MLSQFFKDPYYLAKYYLSNIVIFTGLIFLFFGLSSTDFSWKWFVLLIPLMIPRISFIYAGCFAFLLAYVLAEISNVINISSLLIILSCAYLGLLSAVTIHNSAHQAHKPKWLNRVLGEVCAFQQITSYPVWRIAHLMHHKYSDDPVLDPHPPGQQTFFEYMFSPRTLIVHCINRMYNEAWIEKDEKYKKVWLVTSILAFLTRWLKLVLILLLLGPKFFALSYIPSYLCVLFFFMHFNYFTHRPTPDGSIAILNLNHNLAYRLVNAIAFGVYFHKNHHLKPNILNPMKAEFE